MQTTIHPEEVDVAPVLAVQSARECSSAPDAIGAEMGAAFSELGMYLGRNQLVPAGPPRAIYTAYGPEKTAFTVAFPLAAGTKSSAPKGNIVVQQLPGGRAWRFEHRGPYSELMKTYGQIAEWLKENGLWSSEADWAKYSPMWEEYVTEPGTSPENELITYIYVPRR